MKVRMWLIRRLWRSLPPAVRKQPPDGVPCIRDAGARCTGYEPRKRVPGDWECSGDGHYLCEECAHHVSQTGEW